MGNLDLVLDEMTDKLLAYDEISFLDRVQFVWRRGWSLDSASPPSVSSELRLALKACILERMVAPPKNSPEKTTAWCEDISALKDRFNVIKPNEQDFWKDEPCNTIFESRNIFAPKAFMFFL